MDDQIIKYDLVTSQDDSSVIQKVNKVIAEGWEPLGGISAAHATDYTGAPYLLCAQAMVLRKSDAARLFESRIP